MSSDLLANKKQNLSSDLFEKNHTNLHPEFRTSFNTTAAMKGSSKNAEYCPPYLPNQIDSNTVGYTNRNMQPADDAVVDYSA